MSTDEAVRYTVKNRNRVLFLLRRIGPELKAETAKASHVIARHFLADTRGRAWTPREQAVSAGGTIRAGIVPKVAWNAGTLIMSRSSSDPFKVGGIFFGTEFGGHTGNWWRPHKGHTGYLIYPTLRAHGREYAERWIEAVDDVLTKAAIGSEGAARG